MPERFCASRFWSWLSSESCSWFSVVPTQISYLLHGDAERVPESASSLRFGRSASAPLSPDVIEAAAFALPCNSYGQRVEAAVGLRQPPTVGEAELRALCGSQLGTFKCPDRMHILDELPKGPSGKIQRIKLVDLL